MILNYGSVKNGLNPTTIGCEDSWYKPTVKPRAAAAIRFGGRADYRGVRLGGGRRERRGLSPSRMEVPKGSREEDPKEVLMGVLSGHPIRVREEGPAGGLKASPEESLTGVLDASPAVSRKADPT